tara:strand:- start:75 stop:1175 length:1101 start_codon:yes stop_codon:yes gene_type:complete
MSTTVTHSKRHLDIDADQVTSDLIGNADTATALTGGNKTISGNVTIKNNAEDSTSVTKLIPIISGGNSQLKIKGGNYNHSVAFETSWNDFGYAKLSSTYSAGDTLLDLNKSDALGAVDATTRISTGTSYFNGDVGIGTTSPTQKLSVNGDILIESVGEDASLFFRPSSTYSANGFNVMKVTGSNSSPYASTISLSNYDDADVLVISGSKVGIGTTSPSEKLDVVGNVAVSGDVDVAGNILPGITTIKILPRDFIADDGGRPIAIDDGVTGNRHIESFSSYPMFASVEIPPGFKATLVDIYGTSNSAVTVYEANITTRVVTSRGTGNIGTQINIADVTSNATNYLLIELAQTSGEQVFGGKVTIAKA